MQAHDPFISPRYRLVRRHSLRTMSLLTRTALSLSRTARPAVRSAVATQQAKRRMGSAAAPEWTGIDKVVRGYFPQDDQCEFFAALYLLRCPMGVCAATSTKGKNN